MRLILRLLVLLAVAAVVISIGGRFSDGPIGFFSGGPLVGGDLVEDRMVDWRFAKGVDTIELQLVSPPRSRTVWAIVHGSQLYVPCGLPNFRLWKQWPHEAVEDGRSIIRIDGKRYERSLEKVTQPQLWKDLTAKLDEKYGTGTDFDEGSLWFFRLAPRY